MVVNEKMSREQVDELRFWGKNILSRLSYPEDDPLYSAIEYAWKHPEEITTDSVELTVIANSQVEDGEIESMIEEFYSILVKIAEENDKRLMSHDIMNFWEIGVVSPHTYLYLLYKKGYLTRRGMETAMAEIENILANSPDVDTMDLIVRLCDVVETYRSRQIPYELDIRYNLKIMIGVGKYFIKHMRFERCRR